MAGAVVFETITPASTPLLLTEAQKFGQNLLGSLKIPGAIVLNFALNGYSTLTDLAYFGHKDFEYFCSAKIIQALNRGDAKYSDNVIKDLQGLVWRASDMKRLNQTLLINTNLTRDEAYECYYEDVFEVEKLKKEFKIVSTGKFVYAWWIKWDKAVDNLISAKFILREIPLAYVIKKDYAPVTIMFNDGVYEVDPE